MQDAIQEIFQYWKEVMRKPRAQIDAARLKAIKGRLIDGYSVQDIKDAIHGCSVSRFHCGENDRHKKYQDLTLICRDAFHIDTFIEMSETHKVVAEKQIKYLKPDPMQHNEEGVKALKSILGGKFKAMP
jgi:hypothetical protein